MAAAPEVPQGPLLQALASSSLSRRRAAMSSLRTYLTSKTSFTPLDNLKLWKGLFYCLYMTPKPLNQQRLSIEISELALVLAASQSMNTEAEEQDGGRRKRRRVETQETEDGGKGEGKFLGFVRAFWITIAREWEGIDKARLDKFLFLVRRMVLVGFEGCKREKNPSSSKDEQDSSEVDEEEEEEEYEWDVELLDGYLQILKELPLNAKDQKTPAGLKLHVIDVFVDEMDKADSNRTMDLKKALGPLTVLGRESMTKTVRARAKEALEDERVKDWTGERGESEGEGNGDGADGSGQDEDEDEDEEFGGFDD
ncbi:hypothetical protein B9Z65_2700 [Elsinoe australis]|uniref:Ribosomal RNA-processing protein 1 n=1 Tax=Elsinoe australis TaxID=40998 RepID=A0A2P8A4C2_9PEZI|nr:hypothetical protein B9Z65_2700 [Elsinoe australis]